MNASEMLRLYHDGTGLVLTEDGESTILRAISILAAAEANDGTTRETEDAEIKVQCGSNYARTGTIPFERCATIELERNGLAAEVVRLKKELEERK